MIRTLGLIELNSIAKGYDVADAMLKAADVTLVKAHSICPGKFIAMVSGDVGAVKASVAAGIEVGKAYVVDDLVLPNLHSGIIPAITGTTEVVPNDSLGILEFFAVGSAIVAADYAAKAANVQLIELRLGFAVGGKAFLTLTGDVSAVEAAVGAGEQSALKNGLLVNKTIIPRPHKALMNVVF